MRHASYLSIPCALALTLLVFCLSLSLPVNAAPQNEKSVLPPECSIALRIVTSPEYLQKNPEQLTALNNLDMPAKISWMTASFKEDVRNASDQEQFCSQSVRSNLAYADIIPLPNPCGEFLPLLKKSFIERLSFKDGSKQTVQRQMDDARLEMLVLNEIAPAKLVQRCEVGIQVMQVNLNDRHLAEKYPLPPACEVFFADMEKVMVLPAQLQTIHRQRVIFALENKNTPDKLIEICEQISK